MKTVAYIFNRLIQSFFPVPATPSEWISWDEAFDHNTLVFGEGTFGRTVKHAHAVMGEIDAQHLCPIGVVLVRSLAAWDVFQNHVELVWGYELTGTQLTLNVYDCNNPSRDDITVSLDISSPSPAKTISTNGTDNTSRRGTLRGFFSLHYEYVDPTPMYG